MPGKSWEVTVSKYIRYLDLVVVADTNIRSLLQRLADCQLQIVIIAALNERYDIHSLEDVQDHAILVENRHTRDTALNKCLDDLNHRRIHVCVRQVLVGADVQITQRLTQHLRLLDVDGDELEDAILGQYADDHLALRLVVNVDEWDASSA